MGRTMKIGKKVKVRISEELMRRLQDRVDRGEIPFIISSSKTAAELVREGRGR